MNESSRKLVIEEPLVSTASRLGRFLPQRSWRRFLPVIFCVALPTMLATFYYGFIAADQYETETLISVRSQKTSQQVGMLGAILGADISRADSDSRSIVDYVQSHDAVIALDSKLNLREMFRRPEADMIARISSGATLEEMLDFYQGKVTAFYDTHSGATSVKVRAFRAEDALAISQALLGFSEDLVNAFNRRAEEDTLRLGRAEVDSNRAKFIDVRQRLNDFRRINGELDPAQASGAALEIIAGLEAEGAKAAATLQQMQSYLSPSSAQMTAQRERLNAIRKQIQDEKKRLVGKDSRMLGVLAQYETLMLEREIAEKEYLAAVASLETARLSAQQQHNYVVTIVAPHLAEEALYPRRIENIVLIFILSFLIFGIVRLTISGVKDHLVH